MYLATWRAATFRSRWQAMTFRSRMISTALDFAASPFFHRNLYLYFNIVQSLLNVLTGPGDKTWQGRLR